MMLIWLIWSKWTFYPYPENLILLIRILNFFLLGSGIHSIFFFSCYLVMLLFYHIDIIYYQTLLFNVLMKHAANTEIPKLFLYPTSIVFFKDIFRRYILKPRAFFHHDFLAYFWNSVLSEVLK